MKISYQYIKIDSILAYTLRFHLRLDMVLQDWI